MRYRDKSGQLCVVLGGGAETHPRPKRRWCVREGCGCVHIDMSAAAGTPTVRWTCGAARRRSSRRWLDLCVCLAVLVKPVSVVCRVVSRVGLRLRSLPWRTRGQGPLIVPMEVRCQLRTSWLMAAAPPEPKGQNPCATGVLFCCSQNNKTLMSGAAGAHRACLC
jgi:hypothetical protein